MEARSKMYILVKDGIPLGKAVVGIAHASLACYLKFQESEAVKQWLEGPFYKTICLVSEQEFEKAKSVLDHLIIIESTLDHAETIIAFKPRTEYPKFFKYLPLFKG